MLMEDILQEKMDDLDTRVTDEELTEMDGCIEFASHLLKELNYQLNRQNKRELAHHCITIQNYLENGLQGLQKEFEN